MVRNNLLVTALILAVGCFSIIAWRASAQERNSTGASSQTPNIVWITAEDISPDLGSYGTPGAVTPHLDQLAQEGIRYTNAFATSGACSPSRAAIITGMHAPSIGAHHMRTRADRERDVPGYEAVPPPSVRVFTEYLRKAGYYTTNNVKTDYQFRSPVTAWDESSNEAHWRGRTNEEQPFFSVFNLVTTHASQIWEREDEPLLVDAQEVEVPPYYPDVPAVRNELARYLTNIQLMDKQVGDILDQLEEDNLLDETIVFFFSDHGTSLLRGKRTIYDAGTRVPLIIRFPDQKGAGTVTNRMVSLVDLAPTMLSLVHLDIPEHLQGRAFLGSTEDEPRQYTHAAMDRIGSNYDMVRSVHDRRFHYIKNFMPEKPYMQPNAYRDQSHMVRTLKQMNEEGKLKDAEKLYFQSSKPEEELYDLQKDPYEVNNLADDPEYQDELRRLRRATHEWMIASNDKGFVPEEVMVNELFMPNGTQYQTRDPVLEIVETNGAYKVAAACPTEGASVAYKVSDDSRWQLYHEPVDVAKGDSMHAVAIRIGFKQSDTVSISFPE